MKHSAGKLPSASARGIIYSAVHFAVEVVSFYIVYSRFASSGSWFSAAFFYDALAFLPQGFFGMLTDRFTRLPIGSAGMGLAVISLFIPNDAAALTVLAVGNAMVHTEGAQMTLRGTGGKLAPSGLFVGGGSFGVVTGMSLASFGGAYSPAFFAVLAAGLCALAALIAVDLRLRSDPCVKDGSFSAEGFSFDNRKLPLIPVVVFAFLTVCVRAYAGYAIPLSWNRSVWQSVLLFSAMGLGKMAGGAAADRYGVKTVSALSLAGALPFMLIGDSLMSVSLIGVFLFSMTMTCSLGVLVSRMPSSPGFAFGITTIGLFTGTAAGVLFKFDGLLKNMAAVTAATVATLILFAVSSEDGSR